jgi:hypothetical protein
MLPGRWVAASHTHSDRGLAGAGAGDPLGEFAALRECVWPTLAPALGPPPAPAGLARGAFGVALVDGHLFAAAVAARLEEQFG